MAIFMDLPPEIRLVIYNLLLEDPLQRGHRISHFIPENWPFGLMEGSRTVADHNVGRPREISKFRSYIPIHGCARWRAHLHHVDFGNLVSLARSCRRTYIEACSIIYRNADFTVHGEGDDMPVLIDRFILQTLSLSTRECIRTLHLRFMDGIVVSPLGLHHTVPILNDCLPHLRHLSLSVPYYYRWHHDASISAEVRTGLGALARLRPDIEVCIQLLNSVTTFAPRRFREFDEATATLQERCQQVLDCDRQLAAARKRTRRVRESCFWDESWLAATLELRSLAVE